MIPVRRNIDPDPSLWGVADADLMVAAVRAHVRAAALHLRKGASDPEVIEAHAIADRMDVEMQRRGVA